MSNGANLLVCQGGDAIERNRGRLPQYDEDRNNSTVLKRSVVANAKSMRDEVSRVFPDKWSPSTYQDNGVRNHRVVKVDGRASANLVGADPDQPLVQCPPTRPSQLLAERLA